MSNFTHLHLHTCYSLGSGTIRIDDLINIAKRLGNSSYGKYLIQRSKEF